MDGLELRPMRAADVDGVLAVQREAFAIEARLYDDPGIPPLHEDADGVLGDLATGLGFVAVADGKVVGSVRVRVDGNSLQIGRLAVSPDLQGRGIGSALLALAETAAPAERAVLFTGHLSEGNLRLYRRAGYTEQRRTPAGDRVVLVHLAKTLAATA
jgi:predicted N-acetyltransferase YhbS